MLHFMNDSLRAPNVLTTQIDYNLVAQLNWLLNRDLNAYDFYMQDPKWSGDIKWISSNSILTYRMFRDIFRQIDVAKLIEPYIDLEEKVMLYSGFLVVRQECSEPDWHEDWIDADNEAFTLLTPLTKNSAGFGLLYQTSDGLIAEYDYKVGEAIIFGDDFVHSTKPGKSEEPVVLLSYTFGTDKMVHWPKISRTAGYQGNLIRLPDGTFLVRDADQELPPPAVIRLDCPTT